MPTKKLKNKRTRKRTRPDKKSVAVTIPVSTVRSFSWKSKQKVAIKRNTKRLVIRDWKK